MNKNEEKKEGLKDKKTRLKQQISRVVCEQTESITSSTDRTNKGSV